MAVSLAFCLCEVHFSMDRRNTRYDLHRFFDDHILFLYRYKVKPLDQNGQHSTLPTGKRKVDPWPFLQGNQYSGLILDQGQYLTTAHFGGNWKPEN